MKENILAPIILFVYNRPWHTEQTLSTLMENELAKDSILYIHCDGIKKDATNKQVQKIEEVRKIVRTKQWCKEIYIIESDENKGLANSIIGGVSKIIKKYGKVIVLEDDLITSSSFLNYMNQSLNYYENYKSVFSISADRPPFKNLIPDNYLYDVFVSLRSYSYGWGTWSDRWQQIDWEMDNLTEFCEDTEMVNAFNRGGEDMKNMLISQRSGIIDSWSIRFCFAHFISHAISIMPCKTYIKNIGMDGSGTHCQTNKTKNNIVELSSNKNPLFLKWLYEDRHIINAFYSGYYPKKRSIWKKTINHISRLLGGENIFNIKKKIYC